MNSRTYVVTRLGLGSLVRWGFAAGALVACFPALACSVLFFVLTASVHRTLEGWRDVGVTLLGQRLSLDLINLLHLDRFLDLLRAADALGVFGILLAGLLLSFASGLIAALALALLGVFYNATGRLELELRDK